MYRWCDYKYVAVFAIGYYLCNMLLAGHILLLISLYEYGEITNVSMSLYMSL